MPNNAIQKIVMCDIRRNWRKVEELLEVTKQQALKTMMRKKDFERMLEIRFPPYYKQPRPKPITRHAGNIDDDDNKLVRASVSKPDSHPARQLRTQPSDSR